MREFLNLGNRGLFVNYKALMTVAILVIPDIRTVRVFSKQTLCTCYVLSNIRY